MLDVPLVGAIFDSVLKQLPDADVSRQIHEAVRRLIGAMVSDLIEETERRISEASIKSIEDLRGLGKPIAGFSEEMRAYDAGIKHFLFNNMYRHYKLNRMTSKGRRVVQELFQLLVKEPECLPTEWRMLASNCSKQKIAQIVADYIGGMTDRSALDDHHHLFNLQSRIS